MTKMKQIAALFVQPKGAYFGLPEVELWDEERDARTYSGPHPVVAHPPCQRWGRFANGGPNREPNLFLGEDNGCFIAALQAVREFGGVLEHPAHSAAWKWHGLTPPDKGAGWQPADDQGGMTCYVEQGAYGHLARKPTWLYACKIRFYSLTWIATGITFNDTEGMVLTKASADRIRKTGVVQNMSKKQRAATPDHFRDLLIRLARSAD